LFSAGCATEIDANIRKQGAYFQKLENKRLTATLYGFSTGFAGFLPLRSATDCIWIAVKPWPVISGQRPVVTGIRDQKQPSGRILGESFLFSGLDSSYYDEMREITGKV
jgi:hypothetical protein